MGPIDFPPCLAQSPGLSLLLNVLAKLLCGLFPLILGFWDFGDPSSYGASSQNCSNCSEKFKQKIGQLQTNRQENCTIVTCLYSKVHGPAFASCHRSGVQLFQKSKFTPLMLQPNVTSRCHSLALGTILLYHKTQVTSDWHYGYRTKVQAKVKETGRRRTKISAGNVVIGYLTIPTQQLTLCPASSSSCRKG